MTSIARKPRLTIVSESYWPELTSTSQLITELAESMCADFQVEVLTTQPRFNGRYAKQAHTEERRGVSIRRLWATNFPKVSKPGRLMNWLTFFVSLSVAVLLRQSPRKYLFLTNPPTAPWAILLSRHPSFVLVHDLYPDLAEAIGAIKTGGLVARAFDSVNRIAFQRSRGLIALGEDMRDRLQTKFGDKVTITVIHNWADGNGIRPSPKQSSKFALLNGIAEKFVFLYAGNFGLFQDLATLVDAVEAIPDDFDNVVLLFVGDGVKKPLIDSLAKQASRVMVRGFVPYEEIGDLYASADVGLIALEPGVEKTNVPSKTYSILAAGMPFLAVCTESTDLQALADQGCGECVPNEAGQVSSQMQTLLSDSHLVSEMGRRSREIFDEKFSRPSAMTRYRNLLLEGP